MKDEKTGKRIIPVILTLGIWLMLAQTVDAAQGREPLLKKGFCKNPRFLQCGILVDIGRRIFDGRFVFMAYKKNS